MKPARDSGEENASWKAMIKFADGESLSDQEWRDLSAVTLIDRTRLMFELGNCRWARSEKERQDNERFYKSLARKSKKPPNE